ncbi:F-box protein CPR1 [Linum grandiflorum]
MASTMAPGGGGANDYCGGATFLTEDTLINILLRLPTASCIARFRCVCRTWRNLLSDPNLIRKILFFQSSDDQKALKILITGKNTAGSLYSIYSYEKLRPIAGHHDLPTPDGCDASEDRDVIGCCDGIFCISHMRHISQGGFASHNIVLWNPVTSEIKILPPGPHHPARTPNDRAMSIESGAEHIGFGFDPETKDYKVVRVLEFDERYTDDDEECDPSELYHGPLPLVLTEVYSLKNDSWRTLNVSNDRIYIANGARYLHHQWDQSRNEKCYWFLSYHGVCDLVSFDMSTEVFECVPVSPPQSPGLRDFAISRFMLKGMVMVTFYGEHYNETWGMLKYGVAESWTKLFASPIDRRAIGHLEVWKDGMYICSCNGFSNSRMPSEIFACDLAGETIRDHVESEALYCSLIAHIFTPTRVSLSQVEN